MRTFYTSCRFSDPNRVDFHDMYNRNEIHCTARANLKFSSGSIRNIWANGSCAPSKSARIVLTTVITLTLPNHLNRGLRLLVYDAKTSTQRNSLLDGYQRFGAARFMLLRRTRSYILKSELRLPLKAYILVRDFLFLF